MEWLIENHSINTIINKQDNYGNTALHFAISGSKKNEGSYDITETLISNGSDVNAMNYDFEFPIHLAAQSGNL